MESSNLEEALVLEDLSERNYEQNLDVVLTNNSDPVLHLCVDNKSKNLYKSNKRLSSQTQQ